VLKLPLKGYQLRVSRVEKHGIQAASFQVYLTGSSGRRLADSEFEEVSQAEMPPVDDPLYPPTTTQPSRSLGEILGLIRSSQLSERVKSTASAIFTRLGEAEARVHGGDPGQVHFHEVGGVDAIVDIVSAGIGLEILEIEQVLASPLHLGGGFIRFSHGLYPVPAPATANLLMGVPVYTTEIKGELVTPTGAAILTTVCQGFGPLPSMTVRAVGYGAGTRQREFPNVLRAFLGETGEAASGTGRPAVRAPFPEQHEMPVGPGGYHEGPAVVLEANIDDMNPQLFERLFERLLESGALDVLLIPVQMKKGRPGALLQVLSQPETVDTLLGIIFVESTTIGVRTYPVTKRMLQREVRRVETPLGPVRIKVARLGEQVVNLAPEYEDCYALSVQSGRPLKEVYALALAAAQAGEA
jgi:uncharacterized protein (TIGR00299 family) protein